MRRPVAGPSARGKPSVNSNLPTPEGPPASGGPFTPIPMGVSNILSMECDPKNRKTVVALQQIRRREIAAHVISGLGA